MSRGVIRSCWLSCLVIVGCGLNPIPTEPGGVIDVPGVGGLGNAVGGFPNTAAAGAGPITNNGGAAAGPSGAAGSPGSAGSLSSAAGNDGAGGAPAGSAGSAGA